MQKRRSIGGQRSRECRVELFPRMLSVRSARGWDAAELGLGS